MYRGGPETFETQAVGAMPYLLNAGMLDEGSCPAFCDCSVHMKLLRSAAVSLTAFFIAC